MQEYYLYIIQSEKTGILYKGISQDVFVRLIYHNSGLSTYTKSGTPWRIVFIRKYNSKSEALVEEKRIKRCNRKYLDWYINQPFNALNNN
jgi:putative endonuclease